MTRGGTVPSSKKIMFAHIALLGFQRAGGLAADFRHAHYFTSPFRFCKRRRRFFSRKSNIKLSYAGNPIFRKSSFHSHFERNSMNSSDCLLLQMVAHPIES